MTELRRIYWKWVRGVVIASFLCAWVALHVGAPMLALWLFIDPPTVHHWIVRVGGLGVMVLWGSALMHLHRNDNISRFEAGIDAIVNCTSCDYDMVTVASCQKCGKVHKQAEPEPVRGDPSALRTISVAHERRTRKFLEGEL